VLRQIVTQGGRNDFVQAAKNLKELSDLEISPQQVETLTERIGSEWAERRDREAVACQQNQLGRTYAQAPRAAAVMLDGGRLQTRLAGAAPGVHEPAWREPKYACCLTLPSKEGEEDPQPEPPGAYLEPEKVKRLVREMERSHGVQGPPEKRFTGKPKAAAKPEQAKSRGKRARSYMVRTAVATLSGVEHFRRLVAAEVYRRGLDLATHKACVCDGQASNWTVYEQELSKLGFIAILDFLHLLTYLYAAAQAAGGDAQAGWDLYVRWLRWAWQGKRTELLTALREAAVRLGDPPESAAAADPRQVLARTVNYVVNQLDKMDYPRYRRLGLPCSSAPVEAMIKQFNYRVKGSEKFWVPAGAEAVLQIRAAELSEDGRADREWNQPRPRAMGCRYSQAPAA
jgi:hypothetical protein